MWEIEGSPAENTGLLAQDGHQPTAWGRLGSETGQSQLLVKGDTTRRPVEGKVLGRDSWGLKRSEVGGDTGTGRGGVV